MSLTPQAVERIIDAAGRSAVFARAEALGWPRGSNPPLWVWAEIARAISALKDRQP